MQNIYCWWRVALGLLILVQTFQTELWALGFTADLKFTLTAETKAWMVVIGRHCNKKYRSEMENVFTLIEEFNKKLNRPIKDLDDIRIAMTALREIREQQISIDFRVGPIEVTDNHLFMVELSRVGRDELKYRPCVDQRYWMLNLRTMISVKMVSDHYRAPFIGQY